MSKSNEERDIYYIPPNFLASGRLFGGMIRARNAIEACVLVLLTGIPIIKLPMSLTVRIIILCLLPLPLGIFGIIGFEGDSLSEFAINWVRWFIHRRSLYRSDVTIPETARKQKKRIWEQEATKPPKELGIRIKQPRKKRKRPTKTEKQLNKNNRKMVPSHKKQVTYSEDFVPVKDIRNGINCGFPLHYAVSYLYTKESIMKFSNTVRRREVAFMIRLLTIFGVVEQRQMRLLFDHMSNRSYGQILARLRQEGLAYFSPDGQFLATSRYSLDHGKTQEAIMAFWAFIQMSDHVLDFCASEPPAILSFSSADKDYDLISGSQRNIPSINASRTLVPEASVRLIVVDDMKSLDELIPRDDNDYGVLTGSDGVEQIYKL